MNIYMFVINAKPFSDTKVSKITSEAIVHCWVIAEDDTIAESVAYSFISLRQFEPVSTEHAFLIQPEQIPGFHESEQRLYQRALRYGIAADFLVGADVLEMPEDIHMEFPLDSLQ